MMNLYAFVFYKYICWKIKKNIFLAENLQNGLNVKVNIKCNEGMWHDS